jgi:protein-L-isoaspartate(D-aspartate) O-methyltransferase
MAWSASAATNEQLINNLVRLKLVTNVLAIAVMRAVDRALFVPSVSSREAYQDHPVSIGFSVTISAPHMHAMMLDLMAPHLGPGSSALDVGSGSGYIVACLAKMGAKVFGVEHISELVPRSIDAVVRAGVARDQFDIREGDGRQGLESEAPFDVIHVGAAARPQVVPVLMKQLKPNGILIIPVDEGYEQTLYKYSFGKGGDVKKEHVCGVRFVPLTDR